jgi:hypothetical protein
MEWNEPARSFSRFLLHEMALHVKGIEMHMAGIRLRMTSGVWFACLTLCGLPLIAQTPDSSNLVAVPPTHGATFVVTKFGAVADGAVGAPNAGHNSAPAINAAIQAACSAGGGTVSIPAGTFNIAIEPSVPRPGGGVAAITIPCNSITLQGAGHDSTILSFWLIANGRDVVPTSICPHNPDVASQVKPRTWRGSGIYIVGGKDPRSPRSNVTIRDLRITGNAVINSDNRNPVLWDGTSPLPRNSTCNGWDTSNKGIYLQNNDFSGGAKGVDAGGYYPPTATYFDAVRVVNVHIDHFLGELVYGGNLAVADSLIQSSEFDNSNGDCVSVGGGWQFINNFCHDSAANAFENTPGSEPQTYIGNRMQDVLLDGVGITNFAYSGHANFEYDQLQIIGNNFLRVKRNGISLYNASHALITKNTIIDSHTGILLYDFGSASPAPPLTKPDQLPASPALQAEQAASSKRVPAGKLFVSVAWHYGDPPSVAVKYTSHPGADATTVVDGNGELRVKAPRPPVADAQHMPTGWEVFVGRTHQGEHQQGTVLPLGTDFVLSQEPTANGVSSLVLEEAPPAPSIGPKLNEQGGGLLAPGAYDVSTAWVTDSPNTRIISPPSPRSSITLRQGNAKIAVSQAAANPPENAIGYLIFEGPQGGILHLVGSPDALTQASASTTITAAADTRGLALPGTTGTILSPNVSEVEIRNNVFLADGANVPAAVQCCGVPKTWPMVQRVTIRDNTIGQTQKAKAANLHVVHPISLPPELSAAPHSAPAAMHTVPASRQLTMESNSIQ